MREDFEKKRMFVFSGRSEHTTNRKNAINSFVAFAEHPPFNISVRNSYKVKLFENIFFDREQSDKKLKPIMVNGLETYASSIFSW